MHQLNGKDAPEIMIPVMEAYPRKGQPAKSLMAHIRFLQDPESNAMDRYLRTERSGLAESLDQLQS